MHVAKMIESIIKAGYSEPEIAHLCDLSQPTINRIRNGIHRDPKTSTTQKIARIYRDIFGVS